MASEEILIHVLISEDDGQIVGTFLSMRDIIDHLRENFDIPIKVENPDTISRQALMDLLDVYGFTIITDFILLSELVQVYPHLFKDSSIENVSPKKKVARFVC